MAISTVVVVPHAIVAVGTAPHLTEFVAVRARYDVWELRVSRALQSRQAQGEEGVLVAQDVIVVADGALVVAVAIMANSPKSMALASILAMVYCRAERWS